MSEKAPNVIDRFIDALIEHLRDSEEQVPTNVRISWFTACDFLKLSPANIGQKLMDKLWEKGPQVMDQANFMGIKFTIDRALSDKQQPEFHFS
ncbi:MAG: hypothetical protein LBT46_03085 [Planctomycetaceae bacterium]|jgi:hypothetical protein|nr:hypothetical protein [Planctomycetaceae bacterium]